ncbi:MAG: (2Fe-2S)-binding protein [Clostridiales bacterium]|nr:(2Fe-2S)-binding protein [Clostridiales bacterium]
MSKHAITLKINGKDRDLVVESNELLLNVLRDKLYLTGSKYGCGIAECGACTVLVNDQSVLACLIPAVAADGWDITTVEGLAKVEQLNPVQQAFIDNAAIQCGFCVPGMVVTSTALLLENPDPDEDYVKDYLRGNFCRCTGYVAMVKSVLEAADKWGEWV